MDRDHALISFGQSHALICGKMGVGQGRDSMQDRMEVAARYRARAATVRGIAEMILDEIKREQLLAIADSYERLARDVEEKAIARGAL